MYTNYMNRDFKDQDILKLVEENSLLNIWVNNLGLFCRNNTTTVVHKFSDTQGLCTYVSMLKEEKSIKNNNEYSDTVTIQSLLDDRLPKYLLEAIDALVGDYEHGILNEKNKGNVGEIKEPPIT